MISNVILAVVVEQTMVCQIFYLFMLWVMSFYLFMLRVVFELYQIIVEELYGFLLYIWQTVIHQVGDHTDKQVIW